MDKTKSKKILIIFILAFSGLSGFFFSIYINHNKTPEPKEVVRIDPRFHNAASLVKQLENDPFAGEKIFQSFCASCHASHPFIEVKAPRINDRKAWQQLRKLGTPALLKITSEGVGAMPARGGCFECSDAQLMATIEYMLEKSK